ncbi:hypothetical protein AAV28_19845 [Bradyrhizobium diazoefficiens USDA 110]|nr:hypothetical protein AAV28_19845 [Bradyrhizobium diazoefficiens USDA 110]
MLYQRSTGMAEKVQEHLRIRLGARLLKRIDAEREKNGRTRTDEIEALLEEALRKREMREIVKEAMREEMATSDFYEALVGKFKREGTK